MQQVMTCPFCQNITPAQIIHEAKYWHIAISDNQTYLGRSVVALKRHCESLSLLEIDEWIEFTGLVKAIETALKISFDATMFNWTCLMNDAYKKKNPNDHVHWHFRPRYNHKVEFDGLAFEDLEFGHHYDRAKNREVSAATKNAISSKVQKHLLRKRKVRTPNN